MHVAKSFNIIHMTRIMLMFIVLAITNVSADAATTRGVSTANRGGQTNAVIQTSNPTSSYTYNYMYPYLNNQMRTTLRPENPTAQSTSPINAIVHTEQMSAPRRVVARSVKKQTNNTNTTARRVVPRPANARITVQSDVYRPTNIRDNGTKRDNAIQDSSSRGQSTYEQRSTTVLATDSEPKIVSSARCLADYTECMDRYCVRETETYNRCYCSAKLSQIDATYQPAIESLVNQIIAIKNGSTSWSDAEMDEYWMEKIGKYTGDNSWTKIDDLLNIDWASMESRVRGQTAFATGHEYCVQHLQGCFYMASNLRDAYRSKINTDCATYESSLQRLKNAAESVLGTYQE